MGALLKGIVKIGGAKKSMSVVSGQSGLSGGLSDDERSAGSGMSGHSNGGKDPDAISVASSVQRRGSQLIGGGMDQQGGGDFDEDAQYA